MGDKRIDQLTDSISSSANLDGSELFVVSDPDASQATGYKSKKLTLDTLKNYVGMNCGPIFYDMSDEAADEYRWKIGKESYSAGDVILDHTFTRDVLLVAYVNSGEVGWDSEKDWTHFCIDGAQIHIGSFGGHSHLRWLYIKKGQRVTWTYLTGGHSYNVSTFPIIGCGYFIDTSKSDLFINNQVVAKGESFSLGFDAIVNCNFENDPQGYGDTGGYSSYHVQTMNGKRFLVGDNSLIGSYYKRIFLKAGQVIIPCDDTWTESAAFSHKFSAYPILYS